MGAPSLIMPDDAPPIVAELVGVIGEAAYLQLAQAMGGGNFYVPRELDARHPIAQAVGLARARTIAEHFHGLNIALPVRVLRRARVLELAEMLSADQIAARLQCSRRYVYQVLAEARAARQPGLFD